MLHPVAYLLLTFQVPPPSSYSSQGPTAHPLCLVVKFLQLTSEISAESNFFFFSHFFFLSSSRLHYLIWMLIKTFTCFQYLSCMITKIISSDYRSDLVISLKKKKTQNKNKIKNKNSTHTNLEFIGSFLLTELSLNSLVWHRRPFMIYFKIFSCTVFTLLNLFASLHSSLM